MKKIIYLILLLCAAFVSNAQQKLDYLNPNEFTAKFDQSYGEFERNKYDIILPADTMPHGLVIYIHGGGFKFGDKKYLYQRKDDIKYFIENNMAVATINYRFYNDSDKLGVRLCLDDIKHAIQYFRHNAAQFNIDKTRIGCYGISAGAGASLYFAFHDDLAISGDTTLSGESTRLKCAGAISTQGTYDVFEWQKYIPGLRLVMMMKRDFFYKFASNFYGYKDYKSFKLVKKEVTAELDMLKMIDEQDPPVYLMNLLDKNCLINSNPKESINILEHHRNHAIIVSKKLNKNRVKNYLYTSKQVKSEKDIDYPIREFFVNQLK